MTTFAAYCPVASLVTVRQLLDEQGYGPANFSVPAYAGPGATHAVLHCWSHPAFRAALEAIPEVTIQDGGGMDPAETTRTLCTNAGIQWGADAAPLPDEGTVTAGVIYRLDETLWYVIQQFDRSVYSDHPSAYPALIRRARNPYTVEAWMQPQDQFDAYRLLNPFTGAPDRALHNGQEWRVTQADGAGNNVWEPGVFGWALT